MPPVLTNCPVTGGLIPTGIDVDSLNELKPQMRVDDCPDCGGDHDWTPEDATYAAEPVIQA